MSNKGAVLLTHYDLDGVGCDILLSKMFNFDKKIKCGYSKAAEYIKNGAFSGYDACMITDISLDYGQFSLLSNEYGKRLLYIDHHKASVKMINGLEKQTSSCAMSDIFSATGITYQTFKVDLNHPNIIRFVVAVDAYDTWRHKSHPKEFQMGYDLNTLFWKYKYNDFFRRFNSDISMVWSKQEQEWIDNQLIERDASLDESDRNDFGQNSLLVLDAPGGHINDYGLVYPEYDFFFLLYPSLSGNLSLSIRSNVDYEDVDIGAVINDVKRNQPLINTGGGHRQAGGMDFHDDITLDVILDIVEEVNDKLEELEIPF